MRLRTLLGASLVMLAVTACGADIAVLGEGALDGVLTDLRDCDKLSETFVAVVREAAEDLDNLAEASGGKVPTGDLAARLDEITGTAYFEIAEQLGCNVVAARLDTLEGLRQLNPDSAAGEDLVGDVIRELEQAQG